MIVIVNVMGLALLNGRKTFISLRNPYGYIGHLCLIKKRTLRIS
ncbi:hypothetical protein ACT7C5_20445 [Bacillus pacificus]